MFMVATSWWTIDGANMNVFGRAKPDIANNDLYVIVDANIIYAIISNQRKSELFIHEDRYTSTIPVTVVRKNFMIREGQDVFVTESGLT